jgi:hypothetical protein
LGLICIRAVVVSDRLARQFGDRTEGTLMPIDPSMLAKSIGILTDLDPQRDLAKALQDVVVAAKQLFDVDAAGVMLAHADGQLRWASASDQLGQAIEDNQEIFGQGPCMDAFARARPAAMHDTVPNPSGGDHPGSGRPAGLCRVECAGGAGGRPHRHPGHLRDDAA